MWHFDSDILSALWHFAYVIISEARKLLGRLASLFEYIKSRWRWSKNRRGESAVGAAMLHPVRRVIMLAFISSGTAECILYCSGRGRTIHLHWLSYSRLLYGSGEEYQHEVSVSFGRAFRFLGSFCCYCTLSLPIPALFQTLDSFSEAVFTVYKKLFVE